MGIEFLLLMTLESACNLLLKAVLDTVNLIVDCFYCIFSIIFQCYKSTNFSRYNKKKDENFSNFEVFTNFADEKKMFNL